MDTSFVKTSEVQALLDRAAGLNQARGDARLKAIVRDIVEASAEIIVRHDISEDEFWGAVNFLQKGAPEFGLLVPGSGLEHFLDLFMDAKDAEAGLNGGTPRTIDGASRTSDGASCEMRSRFSADSARERSCSMY